eukprot:6198823-Pleurochrysis_carterae.AAC.3
MEEGRGGALAQGIKQLRQGRRGFARSSALRLLCADRRDVPRAHAKMCVQLCELRADLLTMIIDHAHREGSKAVESHDLAEASAARREHQRKGRLLVLDHHRVAEELAQKRVGLVVGKYLARHDEVARKSEQLAWRRIHREALVAAALLHARNGPVRLL